MRRRKKKARIEQAKARKRRSRINESMEERLGEIRDKFFDFFEGEGFSVTDIGSDELMADKPLSFNSRFMALGGAEFVLFLVPDRGSFLLEAELRAYLSDGSGKGVLWRNSYRVDEKYDVPGVYIHHKRSVLEDFPTLEL